MSWRQRSVSENWHLLSLVIFPAHLMVTAVTMGLRVEHWILSGTFAGVAWLGGRWRALSWRSFPFFLTGVAYDNGRYLTRLRGKIHVADLYHAERRWFGLNTAVGRKTLPEWFGQHPHVLLDFFCGLAYILYLYEVVALAIYLFFRDQQRMQQLAWTFLLVNLLGLVTYVLYPAAPPWYVEKYGLGPARLDALPSAAGAARFDALLGIGYFQAFYSRNPNVFGAMPSLHVAYPVLCWRVMASRGRSWNLGTLLFALLVALAAVYLRHHYVLDVIFGAIFALVANVGVGALLQRGSRGVAV